MTSIDARLKAWLSGTDGRLRKRRVAVVLAGFYVLFVVTYVAVSLFSVGRTTRMLLLPGEKELPFLPIYEYLYVLTYFLPALVIVTVCDYAAFRRLARAYGLTLLITYVTYLAFPVYIERPRFDVSSFHTWLLSIEYLDKPYNQFPSLHVALTWLAVLASQVTPRVRSALVLLAIGVSMSTVFVKQHFIVDVLSGFVLALVAWRLAKTPRSTDSYRRATTTRI